MTNVYSAHGRLEPTSTDFPQGHTYNLSPAPFPLCLPILTWASFPSICFQVVGLRDEVGVSAPHPSLGPRTRSLASSGAPPPPPHVHPAGSGQTFIPEAQPLPAPIRSPSASPLRPIPCLLPPLSPLGITSTDAPRPPG
ncbi:hypothetical protein CapIbe_016933 [Capra ibex]